MSLTGAWRHALAAGWRRRWLLPALLIVWALHTATYAQFVRTRVSASSVPSAPVGETVAVSLPVAAGAMPRPTLLIVRLRNRSSAPVPLKVAVSGSEVASLLVPALRTRRFDVELPGTTASGSLGTLEITGPGDWVLEHAEAANLHGYSTGAASFVVIPIGSDRYPRPPPAIRWLITFAALVLGAVQRSGRHRGWRRLHLALASVVVTFLGLTLLAPLVPGYRVVLSFQTLLLCAVLLHYPGMVQLYLGVLRPSLTRNYRIGVAPALERSDGASPAASSAASRRSWFVVGVLVALASILAIAAIVRAMEHYFAEGDPAFLAIYTRLALDGRLLVGAYSRYHWHHPGPFYFYLQAPLYWLTGQHLHSLAWTAALINLGSVWLVLSRLKRRGGFGVFAAGGLLLLLYVLQTKPLLVSSWNPYVVLLPLAALIVVCADFASTVHLGAVPPIVLLASFITQTHAGHIPCVGALVLTSLVLHLRLRHHVHAPLVRGRTSDRRYLLASAVVLAVVWAPPVVDNLRGDPGNLTFLIHYLRHRESTNVMDALQGYVHYMSALPIWRLQSPWWPDTSRGFDWLASSVALAQFLLLWLVSRWAGLRGRSFHRALCLVSLSGSIVALWSVTRILDGVFSYLVSWVSVFSVTNLIAIVAVVTCQGQDFLEAHGLSPAGRSARSLGRWLPALLVLLMAGYTLPRLAADQRRSGAGSVALKASVAELRSYLDRHGIRRPVFRIAREAWPFAAGTILELSRAGRSVAVEPQWIYMYTDVFAPNGGEDAQFYIVDAQGDDVKSRPEYERIAGSERANIYRVYPLGAIQGLGQTGRILDSSGTRGDPARVLDGHVPLDGTRWDSEGALVLEGPQASVTLAVPPTAAGVALSADANDSYRLECSADGSRFEIVGIVPARPGSGIQTREGHFQGMVTCRQLRISPNAGDGFYSIAEVTFLKAKEPHSR